MLLASNRLQNTCWKYTLATSSDFHPTHGPAILTWSVFHFGFIWRKKWSKRISAAIANHSSTFLKCEFVRFMKFVFFSAEGSSYKEKDCLAHKEKKLFHSFLEVTNGWWWWTKEHSTVQNVNLETGSCSKCPGRACAVGMPFRGRCQLLPPPFSIRLVYKQVNRPKLIALSSSC